MAQVGQTTPSGGREWSLNTEGGGCRQVTVPVNCTVNHIGVWVREQTTVNHNDLRAAIYTTSGTLVYQTAILENDIGSTGSFALKQLAFTGQSLSSGNYVLAVGAGPASSGNAILQGQNDSSGSPTYMVSTPSTLHPTFPSDATGMIFSDSARQWDIYLDYTEAASGYTLTAEQGTYTITGSIARADFEINADQGTLTITGRDAGLSKGFRLISENGTYSLSGQIATLDYSAESAEPDTGTGSSGVFKVRKALVVSTTGRAKWVNYIPVKQVTTPTVGTSNNDGAVEVELLGSGSGLAEWVDYIPIVEVVDGDSGKWRYDNSGWIPILFVE